MGLGGMGEGRFFVAPLTVDLPLLRGEVTTRGRPKVYWRTLGCLLARDNEIVGMVTMFDSQFCDYLNLKTFVNFAFLKKLSSIFSKEKKLKMVSL